MEQNFLRKKTRLYPAALAGVYSLSMRKVKLYFAEGKNYTCGKKLLIFQEPACIKPFSSTIRSRRRYYGSFSDHQFSCYFHRLLAVSIQRKQAEKTVSRALDWRAWDFWDCFCGGLVWFAGRRRCRRRIWNNGFIKRLRFLRNPLPAIWRDRRTGLYWPRLHFQMSKALCQLGLKAPAPLASPPVHFIRPARRRRGGFSLSATTRQQTEIQTKPACLHSGRGFKIEFRL